MAISFALIGLGVSGFLTEFSEIGIISGMGFGAFIGYIVAGLAIAESSALKQDFVATGNLQGKTLDEIKDKVGAPNAIQSCTIADTGGNGSLCTWAKLPYSITLLFDENNICLGVNKEIIGN